MAEGSAGGRPSAAGHGCAPLREVLDADDEIVVRPQTGRNGHDRWVSTSVVRTVWLVPMMFECVSMSSGAIIWCGPRVRRARRKDLSRQHERTGPGTGPRAGRQRTTRSRRGPWRRVLVWYGEEDQAERTELTTLGRS